MCNAIFALPCAAGSLLGSAGDHVVDAALDHQAKSAGQSAGQFLVAALTWWTHSGSVSFDASSGIPDAQATLLPVTVLLLVLGTIAAGVRTAVSRKPEALVALGFNWVSFVGFSVAGISLFAAVQALGDQFSTALAGSASTQFGDRVSQAASSSYAAAFGVICMSGLLILLSIVQWVLMLFRMAALLILAAMLPTAFAAGLAQGKLDGAKRVVSWSITLLLYKPIAAFIYWLGFRQIGDSKDVLTLLQGAAVLMLALIALPVLMKLFSWAGESASASGGGGLALGAAALALRRPSAGGSSSDPDSPAGHAAYMTATGPGSGGGPGGGGASGGGDQPANSAAWEQSHGAPVGGGGPGSDAGAGARTGSGIDTEPAPALQGAATGAAGAEGAGVAGGGNAYLAGAMAAKQVADQAGDAAASAASDAEGPL